MSEETETKIEIEYEQVTLNIPKKIMKWLKNYETVTSETPKEWLEYAVVESVRSTLEANGFTPTPKWQADNFSLNPIFKELTGTEIL